MPLDELYSTPSPPTRQGAPAVASSFQLLSLFFASPSPKSKTNEKKSLIGKTPTSAPFRSAEVEKVAKIACWAFLLNGVNFERIRRNRGWEGGGGVKVDEFRRSPPPFKQKKIGSRRLPHCSPGNSKQDRVVCVRARGFLLM